MNKDAAASAVLATPGVATSGSLLAGIHVSDFVMVLTVISLLLSIAHTIVKWNRK